MTGGEDSIWGMFSIECIGIFSVLVMLILLIKNMRDEAILAKNQHLTEPLNNNALTVTNLLDYEV